MTRTMATVASDYGFSLPDDWNASRLLWDNLESNAERPAYYHEDGVWTYGQLAGEAGRIGTHLLASGSAPGDRILLFLGDTPTYPAAIMGALRAGLVPILINTLSPAEMVQFFLEDSSATSAIVSESFADLFPQEMLNFTPCKSVLIAEERLWAEANPDLPEHPVKRSDMAFWMYSSGSTGKPKGVVHDHEDAAYPCDTFGKQVLGIGPADVCFSIPKIFFAYGFGNSVLFPMRVGAATILMSGRLTPDRVFATVAEKKPTMLFALPTVYSTLVNSPDFGGADMSSIRMFLSAAEVLSEDLANKWKSKFGLPIIEGLGSTEMTHIYLSNTVELQKPGSAGKVVPGYDVRLVAPDGSTLSVGEEGVMEVIGVSRADYYWNRPDKTVETMKGEWLNTGDRFTVDEDGYYYFKGRADDLVKVSGQWVYPMEIEWALNEHSSVREACVAAIEMEDKRKTIRAWVSLKEGEAASDSLSKELRNWVKGRLLPHKYPREIIYLDTLPKTGTDKIDRQALLKIEH